MYRLAQRSRQQREIKSATPALILGAELVRPAVRLTQPIESTEFQRAKIQMKHVVQSNLQDCN
jgi:hypothetical protein